MQRVGMRPIRSPCSISSARLRLRSFSPMTEKPCAAVASWFSGEAVRIQVAMCPMVRVLGDGDVSYDRPGGRGAAEDLDPAVQQRPDEDEQTADEVAHLLPELLRQQRTDGMG